MLEWGAMTTMAENVLGGEKGERQYQHNTPTTPFSLQRVPAPPTKCSIMHNKEHAFFISTYNYKVAKVLVVVGCLKANKSHAAITTMVTRFRVPSIEYDGRGWLGRTDEGSR
jgi:hypothetical protein